MDIQVVHNFPTRNHPARELLIVHLSDYPSGSVPGRGIAWSGFKQRYPWYSLSTYHRVNLCDCTLPDWVLEVPNACLRGEGIGSDHALCLWRLYGSGSLDLLCSDVPLNVLTPFIAHLHTFCHPCSPLPTAARVSLSYQTLLNPPGLHVTLEINQGLFHGPRGAPAPHGPVTFPTSCLPPPVLTQCAQATLAGLLFLTL